MRSLTNWAMLGPIARHELPEVFSFVSVYTCSMALFIRARILSGAAG